MNIHELPASHLKICYTFKVEIGRSQTYTSLPLDDITDSMPRASCRSQLVLQFFKCIIDKEKAMHLPKNLAPPNGSTAPGIERENCCLQRNNKATNGGSSKIFSKGMTRTPIYIYSEAMSVYLFACRCYTDAEVHAIVCVTTAAL